MYSAFISIVLILVILASWTTYSLIFQSSKSIEISEVIQDIYADQKSVLLDLFDLSKILVKDINKKITNERENVLEQTELLRPIEVDSLDRSTINEDNGDNPLEIIIQPSLPEASENSLPIVLEESLSNEESELSMNEMEMRQEIN